MNRQLRLLGHALWRLFENSGFSMAGAVAFSFVVSLFPFSIFLAALAGVFGGRTLATQSVDLMFNILPARVAEVIAPQVETVMGSSRVDLLTIGAVIALFFATSAVETLRAALNVAYQVKETRSYFWCLAQSAIFVLASAAGMLTLAWGVVVGPALATRFNLPDLVGIIGNGPHNTTVRYAIVIGVACVQLAAYHFWLVAGKRRLREIWPGVLVSALLWVGAALLYSTYLDINDYSRFYGGLTQIMTALIFFQVSAMIVILGAEINRALIEARTAMRADTAAS